MGQDAKCTRVNMMNNITVECVDHLIPIEAITQNVSYQGMGFYCSSSIPVEKEVLINIYHSSEGDQNWVETVSGMVKWCKPIGRWYGVGIKFNELDPERQFLLLSYIESALAFHHLKSN